MLFDKHNGRDSFEGAEVWGALQSRAIVQVLETHDVSGTFISESWLWVGKIVISIQRAYLTSGVIGFAVKNNAPFSKALDRNTSEINILVDIVDK